MKKVILSLILFLSFPVISNAVEYDITNFYINAYIEENGDLKVQEMIVLDGTFNGYERDILYANSSLASGLDLADSSIYNASDITDVVIKAKYVDSVTFATFNDTDFTTFIKSTNVPNGSMGKYSSGDINNGYSYKMYYASNNSKVAFFIEYTIKDVIVLHNDVAELYWTFIPSGFEDDLNDVQIKVYLPNSDTSDNFRFWAHGNLTGNIERINNSGVYAYISEVISGEDIDIRLTFDKSLITNTTNVKTSGIDALETIITIETERAEDANNLRTTLLVLYNTGKYGTIVFYITILILGILIYFKYGKSPKPTYYSKYNREFIDDYNVEVVDYLMNRTISPNAMSASIMNMIYKKNISVVELTEKEKQKNKEYIFTLENTDNLSESEKILVEFLFDEVGKKKEEQQKKTFSTLSLKGYAGNPKTCNSFTASYNKWVKNVTQEGENEQFYVKSKTPKIFGFIMLIISIILTIFEEMFETNFVPIHYVLLVAIIFLLYTLFIYKKTVKGSEHYARWNAFKNFLKDFGTFELKELPEVVLWERYLVYATVFGLADKVEKSMNVYINEINMNYNTTYSYTPIYVYIDLNHTINRSINNAVSVAHQRTYAADYGNSHSTFSSGGGFGGGFSSGGGHGGGGGGGRGF